MIIITVLLREKKIVLT